MTLAVLLTALAPWSAVGAGAVGSDPAATAPLSLAGFLVVCGVSGLLAAVAMDVPMARSEDGFVPAYVAAAVLRRTTPSAATFLDALVVHHAVGTVAGGLYGLAYLTLSAVVPGLVAVGGVDLLPHLLATAAVTAFVYAFFAHVVLPRAGRQIYEERATAVRGRWLRATAVFGVAIGVIAPALSVLA